MTAPVRTRVDAAAGPFCKNNFTVSFYVPEEHAVDPPEPNDASVFISRQRGFTAYVAQGGGFVVDDYSISKMANTLSEVGGRGRGGQPPERRRQGRSVCRRLPALHVAQHLPGQQQGVAVASEPRASSNLPRPHAPCRLWTRRASGTTPRSSTLLATTRPSASPGATTSSGWSRRRTTPPRSRRPWQRRHRSRLPACCPTRTPTHVDAA